MALQPVDYFQLPLPINGGAPFGEISDYRRRLGLGAHRGQDCIAPIGTPFRSIANGQVVTVGRTDCLGWYSVVKHLLRQPDADGTPQYVYATYAHQPAPSKLKPGQIVRRGQVIGRVGTSGTCTTGSHLHFTIGFTATSGIFGKTVDPAAFIRDHRNVPAAPAGKVWVTLRENETLTDIAAAHGLKLRALLKLNPEIRRPNVVPIGLRVRIR